MGQTDFGRSHQQQLASEPPIDQGHVTKYRKHQSKGNHCDRPVEAMEMKNAVNGDAGKHTEHEQMQQQDHEHRPQRLCFEQANVPASI
jgi:hypothetical protein